MDPDTDTGSGSGLSSDEAAFFETRGESSPPPEPAAPAEETQEGATEGDEAPPVREPRHVPLSELLVERKKRQEIEKRERELSEQFARADERLRLITEAQQARQQPQEEQPPGPDDPMAQIEYLQRKLQAFEQNQQRQHQQSQQAHQQEQQVRQVVNTYRARADEFRQQQADFDDAYQHVLAARERQLRIQGMTDPSQLAAQIQHDEMHVVALALQQGANPAERLYNLAKEYGYQPKAGDAAADVERLAGAVAKSKSLSQAGGQASATRLDAKTLAKMSDEEFETFMNKQGAKGFRRALHS